MGDEDHQNRTGMSTMADWSCGELSEAKQRRLFLLLSRSRFNPRFFAEPVLGVVEGLRMTSRDGFYRD